MNTRRVISSLISVAALISLAGCAAGPTEQDMALAEVTARGFNNPLLSVQDQADATIPVEVDYGACFIVLRVDGTNITYHRDNTVYDNVTPESLDEIDALNECTS